MILREGIGRIAIGLAIGVAIALLAARALEPLLYQVSPRDPLVVAVAVLVLAACAVLASALPARRAMTIDPSSALREE
jgi:ABC-type antimicrobial peptide transport system permease subunit